VKKQKNIWHNEVGTNTQAEETWGMNLVHYLKQTFVTSNPDAGNRDCQDTNSTLIHLITWEDFIVLSANLSWFVTIMPTLFSCQPTVTSWEQ
jgi:hypothetical protein